MTKQTLERLIEMQKAIAICECIINDIVEGYKLQLATPRTEEEVPDFMREDLKNMLAILLESYQADFEKNLGGAAMKAIIKKPGEKPRVIEIENELSALQEAVEGYIQAVPLAADACIICNEEGKLIGLPYNTRILNEIFVGNILFVGVAGEEFCSLTNEQISLIAERVLNREGN